MAQKNNIEYAKAKGAPAGFVLPFMVTKDALANYLIEDLSTETPENLPLNPSSAILRLMAIGGAVYVKFGDVVDTTPATHGKSTLTLAVNPTENDTITLGDQEYVFKAEITKKAKANLVLDGDITKGVHAKSVLTLDGDIEAGDTVIIGTKVYTFRAAPALDGEVALGADDAGSLANLLSVINLGNLYTLPNTQVYAIASDATTLTIQAKVTGASANAIAITATGDLDWDAATMGTAQLGVTGDTVTINDKTYTFVDELSETAGVAVINEILYGISDAVALDNLKSAVNGTAGEGTTYSTGTEQPTGVEATTNTDTAQLFVATEAGDAGNDIAVSTTGADLEFQDEATTATATLADGHDDDGKTLVIGGNVGTTQTSLRNAINGGTGSGTTYSTALTAHPTIWLKPWAANVAEATARVLGTGGNGIDTTSDFTSGSNSFDVTETAGGGNLANFDTIVPAGTLQEFAIDESITSISLIAAGASTDLVLVEY